MGMVSPGRGPRVNTIRLFVGASAGQDTESQAVLEYTARARCTMPLDIVWMQQADKGFWAGWNTGAWRTPFTGFRWGIPAACGFAGRAIYMDSDFIVRADLADMWRQPIPSVALVRNAIGKLSTSCILFDCAAAKGHVPGIDGLRGMQDAHGTALKYFREHTELLAPFDGNWDCADLRGYNDINDPDIKAIHYSRIETQPHLDRAVARLAAEGRKHWYTGEIRRHGREDLIALFDQELLAAIAAGYHPSKYACPPPRNYGRRDFTYGHHKGEARV